MLLQIAMHPQRTFDDSKHLVVLWMSFQIVSTRRGVFIDEDSKLRQSSPRTIHGMAWTAPRIIDSDVVREFVDSAGFLSCLAFVRRGPTTNRLPTQVILGEGLIAQYGGVTACPATHRVNRLRTTRYFGHYNRPI